MGKAKSSTRQRAEAYFIENIEATQLEVAELFNITPKTVGNWCREDNWEERRLDFHSSPTKIKQLLQQELLSVASGEKPRLPADGISKLMAALDKCEKKADPITVHKILKDLDYFIARENPEFAEKCTEYHKQFLKHRISLESK